MCLASVQAGNMTRDAVDEMTGYKMVSWECIPGRSRNFLIYTTCRPAHELDLAFYVIFPKVYSGRSVRLNTHIPPLPKSSFVL